MLVLTVVKYLLLIVGLSSPYVSAFLTYLLPEDPAIMIGLVCWFFLFFYLLCALILRRWKAVALYFAAGAWLLVVPPAATRPFHWLVAQGFRIHASPVKDYLPKCRLVEFVENGVKQTVGICEGRDMGAYIRSVYYDTTGELALSPSERTPEWKLAIYPFAPNRTFVDSDPRARHLFGGFYELNTLVGEFDGDDKP